MDKEDVVSLDNGILFGGREEAVLSFVTTWMDREAILLGELCLHHLGPDLV